MTPLPLRERPIDIVFVACFACFALTSFGFDSQVALGIVPRADGPLLVQINHWFTESAAPVLKDPPVMMQAMITISAFVYGPMYVLLCVAFWKGYDWIRIPALMFSATVIYSFVPILSQAIWGQPGPRNWGMFLGAYVPYLIAPLALIYRMRHANPFCTSRASS
jgi:hypothetical protein